MSDGAPKFVTNAELALEIRALRSDVKLWILGGVALGQFLQAIDIPASLTAAALGAYGLKVVGSLILTRFGGS